jgi:hypothetical protein
MVDAFADLGAGVRKRVLQAAPAGAPLARGRVTCRYEARAGSASAPVLDAATVALTLPDEDVPGAEALLPVLPGVARGLRTMRVGETADLLMARESGGGGGGAAGSDSDDSAALTFVRVTLLTAAEADFAPDLDFGAMARQFREEGNGLLLGSRDAAGAAAAYEQALFCVAKAEQQQPQQHVAGGGANSGSGGAAAELAKLRVVLHSNRAQALLKLSRWAEAAAECDAALRLDAAHAKSLFRRARASIGAGKLEAARADARALAAQPGALPSGDARALMAELGLAHELPAEAAKAASEPPRAAAATDEGAGDEADAPDEPASAQEAARLLRKRAGKGAAAGPSALELAAKRGFGGLYDDMPDVDELRRHEAEHAARRATTRAAAAAAAELEEEGRGCLSRAMRRVCAFIGCAPATTRSKRRAAAAAAGCC